MHTLSQLSQIPHENFNRFLALLMVNKTVQVTLNSLLQSQGKDPINFESEQYTIDSIRQRPDITYEIILECIQILQKKGLELMERESIRNYIDNRSHVMNRDFDPDQGINTLVWERNHDFKNDL
jgi:hypothetical protein